MMRVAIMLTLGAIVAGCSSGRDTLPAVRWSNDREALDILARRSEAVRTLQAEGLITLVRPDGESVRFDLAMVRSHDNGVRLRAWKLGRAVFDLTVLRDGGVWLLTPDDPSLEQKVRKAGVSARQLAEAWERFNGSTFHSDGGRLDDTGKRLRYHDDNLTCEIDRRTLTPVRYTLADDAGTRRFTLDLSDYRVVSGVPVAHRYVATSDDGVIRISLRDVEINADLAAGAFRPPRRAEKLP